jgi:hypothetical protein
MAYDRYDSRDFSRGERSRWRDDRFEGRDRDLAGRDERGFFERAGDEVASWFGDEDAERRRREDQRMMERDRGYGRDWRGERDWDRNRSLSPDQERGNRFGRDSDQDRSGWFGGRSYRGSGARGAYDGSFGGSGRGFDRDYEPVLGGYTVSERSYTPPGYGRERSDWQRGDLGERSFGHDPHYRAWRQRQLDELDRDYDDYRRENQSRFESDFGGWRERRMQKRGLLGNIREHMEVVGNDDQHIGTVDRVAGDRIILTKSDPESGGAHHSLSCHDIDRIEGDRVVLDCSADQARERWLDESRSRALFEREDQGDMGDRVLDRSFSGTYR